MQIDCTHVHSCKTLSERCLLLFSLCAAAVPESLVQHAKHISSSRRHEHVTEKGKEHPFIRQKKDIYVATMTLPSPVAWSSSP